MPHGLVHESEEKLRAHFLHTGTPSATGLYGTKHENVAFKHRTETPLVWEKRIRKTSIWTQKTDIT